MNNLKKHLSIMLMLVTVLSCFMQYGTTAEAKVLPKLNAATKTVKVGKTVKVKLLNNKKKVKWSVTSSNIKIVKKTKKYAKVKGISVGYSVLAATVGGRTFTCSFTVEQKKSSGSQELDQSRFDTKKAENATKIEEFIVNGYLYSKVTSNYDQPMGISAKCNFYDSLGNPVDYSSDSVSFLENGHTYFLQFSLPDVEYSNYEIAYEYSAGLENFYHSSIIDDLSVTDNYVEDPYSPYVMLTVSNAGKEQCYSGEVCVVYYDANGNIIAIEKEYIGSVDSGSAKTIKSYTPYNSETYEDIAYDHYDVMISYAYHLGKEGEVH